MFLFMVGAALLAFPPWALSTERDAAWWVYAIVLGCATLGSCMLLIAVFGSPARVQKWTDLAGNHEVMAAVFLIAFPIAWFIRKFIRGDAN